MRDSGGSREPMTKQGVSVGSAVVRCAPNTKKKSSVPENPSPASSSLWPRRGSLDRFLMLSCTKIANGKGEESAYDILSVVKQTYVKAFFFEIFECIMAV